MNKKQKIKLNERWFRFELIPAAKFLEKQTKTYKFKTLQNEIKYLKYETECLVSNKKKEALEVYHPKKLIEVVKLIPRIKLSPEYKAFPRDPDECYYKIDLPDDKIRFQINVGSLKPHPDSCPEIAIDTLNRFPDNETLEEVKKVLKLISSKVEFQVRCYNQVFSIQEFMKIIDKRKKK